MNSYLTFCTVLRNESNNVRRILDIGKSLCLDMVIVVQKSEDATLKICREYTNNVIERPVEPPEVSTDWTFWLDGDEVPSYELMKWLEDFIPPKDIEGVRIPRFNYINGLRIEENDGKDIQFRMVTKNIRWKAKQQRHVCHIYPIVDKVIILEYPKVIYHHRTLEKIERTTKIWNDFEPRTSEMCNDYLARVKDSLSNSTK
jgi:hypothetical protein